MSFWKKIRELHIEKNRYFRILVVIELCLLIYGIWGLFGKDDIYHYGMEQIIMPNAFTQTEKGYYLGEDNGTLKDVAVYNGISLPRGTYTVSLQYETDTYMMSYCNIVDSSGAKRAFLCNGQHLYDGLSQTSFQIWVLDDRENLLLSLDYAGEGNVWIKDLSISENNALSRMMLFWIIAAILLVNVCFTYFCYDKKYGISMQDKSVMFGLALVILFASLPLMTDGMISSGDLIYHLMRIVGVRDGLLMGQLPVRIAPEWQQGYGYASSIFYGETLIAIASIFRLIGFPLVTSYRMFLFVINVLTTLIAYYSFLKIFRDKYIGLVCAAVYTLSIYRISKTFVCGSLGETLGIVFLPLLVYGFYRVFTQSIEEDSYKKAWVPLTIGFTGLIQSHLLSGEMAGLFTIILCIIMYKKVFRGKTFVVLAKTVIYSILLSLWFLIPFVDYMLRDDFIIQHVSARTIQYRGLYLAHLFFTYYSHGSNVFFDDNGMAGSQPMGVGIALWLPLIVFAGILFFRKADLLSQTERGFGKLIGAMGILAMLMSLSMFPWDKIQSLSSVTATLVSSVQFPNRFLTIAVVCLTAVCGLVFKWVYMLNGELGRKVFIAGIAGLLAISSLYLTNNVMASTEKMQVYDETCIGSGYVAGAEYLPTGTDTSQLTYRKPITTDNIEISEYEKNGLRIRMTCNNSGTEEGTIELPLLFYRGYKAWDASSGEQIDVYKGNNNVVSIVVPLGYNGCIEVDFISPWYWRVAEVISGLVFLCLCFNYRVNKKKMYEEEHLMTIEEQYVEEIRSMEK